MGKDLKGREIGIGIAQRKDGRYEARYTDRFGNRKSIYDFSLKRIQQKLLEAVTMDKENKIVRKRLTLNEWFKIWYDSYKKGYIKETTLYNYRHMYDAHIRDSIGEMWLDEITRNDIQLLISSKYHFKTSYLKRIGYFLHNILQYAYEDDYIQKNPVFRITYAKEEDKDKKALSQEEERIFLEYAKDSTFYEFYLIALNTGMRVGEMCALNMTDINIKRKFIVVNKTIHYYKDEDGNVQDTVGSPKTKTSNRIIPMNKTCLDAVMQYMDKRASDDYFFFRSKRNARLKNECIWRDIQKIKKRILVNEGLEITMTPHTLRHTFATRCFEKGISPKIVQSYLGHAKVGITLDIYTHVSTEVSMSEIEKLVM